VDNDPIDASPILPVVYVSSSANGISDVETCLRRHKTFHPLLEPIGRPAGRRAEISGFAAGRQGTFSKTLLSEK